MLLLVGALCQTVVAAPSYDATIKPFLAKHCLDCHGPDAEKGRWNLAGLRPQWNDPDTFDRWVRVYEQINSREMPPADNAQPTDAERRRLLDRLGRELRTVAAARTRTEGRVELRRLNRIEYQNTIHDLLDIEANVMELLPEDPLAFGFDKISTALTLSPVQMEKYLDAADVALDAAIGVGPQPKYVKEHYPASDLVASWATKNQRTLDDGGLVIFNSGYSPTELRKFRAPAPGRYRVRISASGFQTAGKPATMRVYAGNFGVGGKTRLLGHYELPAEEPKTVEIVERFEGRNDTLKVIPYGTINWQADGSTYTGPGIAVYWIEVEGPLEAREWPPASRRKLLGEVDSEKGTVEDAEAIVRRFAARAFRRPVTDAELAPYLSLVRQRFEQGATFAEALRVGLKAVLVSPRFLFLDEQPGKLDDYALASRLSYFLWSTMPDEELLALAASGKLTGSLRDQVERMLADPRAQAFTENFTGQWLSLRNIEFTMPDMRLYPEFDEFLQVSMVRETHAFFDEVLKHDLSLLNFIDSDFAMLNERLAKLYNIPDVDGPEIRKVPLKPEWHRGGVMAQGSVLKITANGTTTSPVLRGVWIADRILGQPAPPPPSSVPAVEPDIRGAKTIREQLAKHREIGACASCHTKIDPLGFALENYDVIGGWRDRYRITPERGQKADWITLAVNQRDMRVALGPQVDAGDTLPDGRSFHGLDELKRLLTADPGPIARGLAEKLLIYATGHGLVFSDEPALDAIVTNVKTKKYGFRSLVHEIVRSEVFLNK
jgi:hypothetical protein